jgi:hypothetical protein
VDLRVDRAMSSLMWGRDLSPLCRFACTAIALRILSYACPDGVIRISCIVVQSLTPSSHRGPGVLRIQGAVISFGDF